MEMLRTCRAETISDIEILRPRSADCQGREEGVRARDLGLGLGWVHWAGWLAQSQSQSQIIRRNGKGDSPEIRLIASHGLSRQSAGSGSNSQGTNPGRQWRCCCVLCATAGQADAVVQSPPTADRIGSDRSARPAAPHHLQLQLTLAVSAEPHRGSDEMRWKGTGGEGRGGTIGAGSRIQDRRAARLQLLPAEEPVPAQPTFTVFAPSSSLSWSWSCALIGSLRHLARSGLRSMKRIRTRGRNTRRGEVRSLSLSAALVRPCSVLH